MGWIERKRQPHKCRWPDLAAFRAQAAPATGSTWFCDDCLKVWKLSGGGNWTFVGMYNPELPKKRRTLLKPWRK